MEITGQGAVWTVMGGWGLAVWIRVRTLFWGAGAVRRQAGPERVLAAAQGGEGRASGQTGSVLGLVPEGLW